MGFLLINHFFAFQRCRTGFGDLHPHKVSHPMRATVKDHHTVLLRAAKQLVARTLGDAFYQHLVRLAHTAGICLGRKTVLKGDDFVQTANLHFFGHIVRQMLGGIRARTLGILEHESGIVAARFHQRKG